jgi:hypothetical protein
MRVEGHDVLLSASDLMRFMSCKHATALDLRYARGEPLEPADDTEDAKILQKQGDDHESRYLAKLKAEGHSVIEFAPVPCSNVLPDREARWLDRVSNASSISALTH